MKWHLIEQAKAEYLNNSSQVAVAFEVNWRDEERSCFFAGIWCEDFPFTGFTRGQRRINGKVGSSFHELFLMRCFENQNTNTEFDLLQLSSKAITSI